MSLFSLPAPWYIIQRLLGYRLEQVPQGGASNNPGEMNHMTFRFLHFVSYNDYCCQYDNIVRVCITIYHFHVRDYCLL